MRLGWIALALFLWLPAQAAPADNSVSPVAGGTPDNPPAIALYELPEEARVTLRAIKQGGPFAYQRDGAEFRNYERILPQKPRRYYREYTVRTPGARNRGARRIISGAASEYYYTADHYQSFKRIRE